MSDADLLEAESLRVLERFNSIPRADHGVKRKGSGKPGRRSPSSLLGARSGPVPLGEAVQLGETALSRVSLNDGGGEEAIVRALVDGRRSLDSLAAAAGRTEDDEDGLAAFGQGRGLEARAEKVAQLKRWARDRASKVDDLVDLAFEARAHANPIMTGVRYGAALLCRGGHVYTGCNVESNEAALNTSAEKMALLKALSAGHSEAEMIVITWDQENSDRFPMPSGASRQYLAEFGNFEIILVKADAARTKKELQVNDLLPNMNVRSNKTNDKALQRKPFYPSTAASPRSDGRLMPLSPASTGRRTISDIHSVSVREWSVRHVLEWLDKECDLPSYQYNFQEASVNGAMLLQLTTEDLQDMLGVHHPLHLTKLKRGIQNLRKREVVEFGSEGAGSMDDIVDVLGEGEIVMVAGLKDAFDRLDTERSGRLEASEIKAVLQALGVETGGEQVSELIRSFGSPEDAKMTFPQFVRAFMALTQSEARDGNDDAGSPNDSENQENKKNRRLVVGPDGNVKTRENSNYAKWLQAQQARFAANALSGEPMQDTKMPDNGKAQGSELALWLKGDEKVEKSARIQSFLKGRRRKPQARTASQDVQPEDFARLKRLFDRADRDCGGELTRHEAARALSKTGMKITPVEFGQYLRLQGLDSSVPVDVFEFTRAFAYFAKQREIQLGNAEHRGLGNSFTTPTIKHMPSLEDEDLLGGSGKQWPSVYDPTGLLTTLRRRSRSSRRRKHSKKRKFLSSRRARSASRSSRGSRRSTGLNRRKHRYDSDTSSSSENSASDSSDQSCSTKSSFSSSGSSRSSSRSLSSSDSRSTRSSFSDTTSSSSDSSAGSESGSSNDGLPKYKMSDMGRQVVKRVQKAFSAAQRSGSRNQIAASSVRGAFQTMPRSRKSRPIPSKDTVKKHLEKRGIQYYLTSKQFMETYTALCYDSADEVFRPKVKKTSKRKKSKKRSSRNRSPGRSSDSSSHSSSSSGDQDAKYRVGDRVEARFKGKLKWFKGEVTRKNASGTFAILYDDGDLEKSVRPSLMRKLVAKRSKGRGSRRGSSEDSDSDEELRKGHRVKAKIRGESRFHNGKVVRVNAGRSAAATTYDIVFDSGEQEKRVRRRDIKSVSKPQYSDDSESNSGKSDGEDELQAGTRVEARYKGGSKYYKGKISRINADGSFAIVYDDGDKEFRVPEKSIRILPSPSKRSFRERSKRSPRSERQSSGSESSDELDEDGLDVGSLIEAKYKGGTKWYKGKISRVNVDGSFAINYEDGDREFRVPAKNIRSQPGTKRRKSSRRNKASDDSDEDVNNLRVGAKVEARYKGGSKYYKGEISRVNADGSFAINYEDGDREFRVPAKNIRSQPGTKRRTSSRRNNASDDSDEDENNLRVGAKVEARYKSGSKYYKGKVMRVNADGSFAILYDDGDREPRVQKKNIRALSGTPKGRSPRSPRSGRRGSASSGSDDEDADLEIGAKVEAKYKGGSKYYKGKITRINADGSCAIAYDDGDRELRVPEVNIRVLGGTQQQRRRTKKFEEADSDERDELTAGSAVEARYKGGSKWYKGKVTRVNADGSYTIAYADGDREMRVAPRLVRALSRPKKRSQRGSSDGSDSEGELCVGSKVEARYKGGSKYYKGKVTRVNVDGSCAIFYDDGDREPRVPKKNIRILGGGKSASRRSPTRRYNRDGSGSDDEDDDEIRQGTAVEAKYKGGSRWFKGKVSRVNADGSFAVEYDDGDREFRVPSRNVRVLKGRGGSRSPRERRTRGARSEQSETEDEDGGELRVGTEVEARYKGGSKYYKGKITRVNADGSCAILYDDGDREPRVAKTKIRVLAGGRSPRRSPKRSPKGSPRRRGGYDMSESDDGDSSIRVGTKVEARYKGGSKYYKGKVSRINADGSCAIAYDDGDREPRVPRKSIRVLGGSPKRGAGRSPRGQDKFDSDSEENDQDELSIGSRVQARFKGGSKMYKGKITRVNADGSCAILYDDGDRESRVPRKSIRALGGLSSPSSRGNKRSPRSASRRGDSDSEGAEEDALRVGAKVEARYKGGSKYYKGKITRVNRDGSCAILYDDGDRELRVPKSSIRSIDGGRSPTRVSKNSPRDRSNAYSDSDQDEGEFKVGTKVEARYKGGSKYYKGKVTRVNVDGSCAIFYDDGDREPRVPKKNIRILGGGKSASRHSPTRRYNRDGSGSDDEDDDEIRQGTAVEAKYKGGSKWFKGKVSRVNADGSFAVEYDDGDREFRVPSRNVRVLKGRGGSRSPRERRTRGARSEQSETEDEDGGELRVGTEVEARYKGGSKYYKGKITRVNADGSCAILYDDGDREPRVAKTKIRVLAGGRSPRRSPKRSPKGSPRRRGGYDMSESDDGDSSIRVGTKVEARYKGGSKYYKGKVTRVNANGSFDIFYDDGDRESRVAPEKVRSLGGKLDGDSAGQDLEAGTKVEARYKGGSKYYSGRITRVNADGSFAILYDDGDREPRVPARNVRGLDGGNVSGKRSPGSAGSYRTSSSRPSRSPRVSYAADDSTSPRRPQRPSNGRSYAADY